MKFNDKGAEVDPTKELPNDEVIMGAMPFEDPSIRRMNLLAIKMTKLCCDFEAWCRDNNIPPNDCYAKILTAFTGPTSETLHRQYRGDFIAVIEALAIMHESILKETIAYSKNSKEFDDAEQRKN